MSKVNYFDVFTNMTNGSILDFNEHDSKTISKQDYEVFCKEFTFEKLKGKKYGEAFCERFELDDCILKNLSDTTAKFHIENLGYIK